MNQSSSAPIRWYRSPSGSGPTLLWLHGGGFFRGSPRQPEAHSVAEALARQGLTVATVGYRLAPVPGLGWAPTRELRPRGRFPLPLDDVLGAYREISDRSPAGVILGGASAGACLAAAATLAAIDHGDGPVGAIFVYGFFHAEHPRVLSRGHRSRGHRRITHAVWAMDVANRNYAGSRAMLAERLAFPGGHDVSGFPRTLMINAEHDNMSGSGDRFASELTDSGVDVEYHVFPGTSHAFLNHPRQRAFADAVSLIARWSRG